MTKSNEDRRGFHKLAAAAFGGMAAGAATIATAADGDKKKISVDPALLASEPHVCRGLNACDGKGHGGENDCGGHGACASVARHECKGTNECKGQGGCGGYPGQNTCKVKGHCAVPLKKEKWSLARNQFEQIMADLGHQVGAAPKAG